MVDTIRHFLEQAQAQRAKSTAMNPLGWVIAMLLSALLFSTSQGMTVLSICLGVTSAIVILAYVACYVYLMIKNPDALRSERYTLSKLAIEKSLQGDDLAGLMDVSESPIDQVEPPRLIEKENLDG